MRASRRINPLLRRHARVARRGIAKLWLILLLPCIVVSLCLIVEVANLWIARAELEDALEAASLAAVKEWGDMNGGDTLIPRQVGLDFAEANTVRGNPLWLNDNYNNAQPNDNRTCISLTQDPPAPGILIFRAIVDDDTPHIFDATQTPSCGGIDVLLDASDEGNLGADNAWGVAFLINPNTAPTTRITKIIIDLQASGGSGVFDFQRKSPILSDSMPQAKVQDGANSQPDISGRVLTANAMGSPFSTPAPLMAPVVRDPGFTDPSMQIMFTPSTGTSPTLTIDFTADPGMDDGFAPGDRFCFGALTDGVGAMNNKDDGDGIGDDDVQAEIFFTIGGVLQPSVTVTFFNNSDKKNDCFDPAMIDALSGSLIVNPQDIPDLPCPPQSSAKNNGQSFARAIGAGRERPFSVHAVGSVAVPSICQNLFGLINSKFKVSARATAIYDCGTRSPRLIRIDELICP